jgi:hypothetical protein
VADWKKTAKAFLLADGGIDDRETAVLRKELFADGVIDEVEMDFLLELRHQASRLAPSFHQLILDALKKYGVAGDAIRPGVASLLRRWIFADHKVDHGEKRYLQELRAAARQAPPDFEALYRECMGA